MKPRILAASLVAAVALLLPATLAAAAPAEHNTSPVFVFGQPSNTIPGAASTVVTQTGGATMTLHTSGLTGGDAVTVWWVIFNNPEACTGGEGGLRCGPPDLHNGAAEASVLYAAGHVIGTDGTASWGGHLNTNDTTDALFGPGLTNPTTADIHFVIHDHGPADPSLMPAEIHSFNVCNPTCTDVQASAHEQ
jgi:hypothetical protein